MQTLVSRVESIAARTPGRIAIGEYGRQATYRQFWEQARAFAELLRDHGLLPGDRVAVVLPNRIEAAVAVYGTWIAGGVAVPLNAQARERDLAAWIEHCDATAVVHEPGNPDAAAAVAASAGERVLIAVEGNGLVASGARGARASRADVRTNGLATILYTSGTTGTPKGVMLGHEGLLANARAVIAYLELVADDSVLSVLPFYYAYGASVLHTHLAIGAQVQLAPNLLFPNLIVQTMQDMQITGFSGVSSTYSLLLKHGRLAQHDLSCLRYITQAGGPMSAALTHDLRTALPGPKLFRMYGQTEATARLTWLPPDDLDRKPWSVGLPIPGVRLKVVCEDGTTALPGEEGEVWAHGPSVMLGYWDNPDATRAALQDGWLRTGDIGHLDQDGYLYLSGRRSDMIKTGAHRVHPADVEDVIAGIPGVLETAVVGVDDETMGQVIKAIIVCDPSAACTAARIKAHCLSRLPAYKVPKLIEFASELPRTASGKVRRHLLQVAGATT